MTRTLLIYAKPPAMGLAKTRLAAGLGKAEAARIARMSFARTLRAARDRRWQTTLYTTPDRYLHAGLGGLWPTSLKRVSQGGGDLTDRLDKGLHEAPRGPVMFIGADAPDISKALLWRGFQALCTHDAVFGPASDGGFWLFGMRRGIRLAAPFEKVRWSGPHAMADVCARLPEGSKVALLPELIDLDEAEDWAAWNTARKKRA